MKIVSFCIAALAMTLLGVSFAAAAPIDHLSLFHEVGNHFDPSAAMGMMTPLSSRARGLVGVRADGANATAILNELKQTFEAFKEENEKELAGIKKNLADVVQTEKVERINAEITKLQKALDETNAMLAAVKVGAGGGDEIKPAVAEHAKAFNKWFRKGDRAVDADMRDLEVKAELSTLSDPDGGYVVPEEMSNTIDRVVGTVSAMRSLATVMTISTDTLKKLVNMGGAGYGWVGEKESRPETATPALRELGFNTAARRRSRRYRRLAGERGVHHLRRAGGRCLHQRRRCEEAARPSGLRHGGERLLCVG